MKIVVLCKFVPNAISERKFVDGDHTTDRVGVDGLLSELDEYAVEEAVKIKEAGDATVTILTVGPPQAADAVRKALQMGADAGVHIVDDSIHGSDALATSLIIAKALEKVGEYDMVMAGMASTDGEMGVVPAMVAERLGLPHVGYLGNLEVADGLVRGRRDGDAAIEHVEAPLPAVVGVTDQINDPRYPSFKGIMAAKKKPVQTWSLDDLGVSAEEVGLSAAWTSVAEVAARPPRSHGEVVTDEGDGGVKLVEFLSSKKFV
jgi:electron transfer flavoprotein beta subunit